MLAAWFCYRARRLRSAEIDIVRTLLTTGLLLVLLIQPAAAIVLVNDTWKDGNRTDPTPANGYSERGTDVDGDMDLESSWYRGGGGGTTGLQPVAAGGPLRGIVASGSNSSWTTYFTPETSPVNLANDGDKLRITWVFSVSGLNTTSTGQGFRLAVVDTPAAARLTDNGSPGSAAYSGYGMFMNMSTTLNHSNSFQLMERLDPATASALLSASASWTGLANGATRFNTGYAEATSYTYTFEATRNGSSLDILSQMMGGSLNNTGTASVTFTDTSPNSGSFVFDTFSVRPDGSENAASTFDTSLFKVEFFTTAMQPGDFNGDLKVDAADYVVWRDTMSGDNNKYLEWRSNFGAGTASGAALGPVPEPSTLLLAVAVFASAVNARRRHDKI